ncbi:MAG: aspartate aminotransferase family protein [Bacteroidales bacterium]|nr:aspartate aminotransferase family protein [Bacteroidales bacterium]
MNRHKIGFPTAGITGDAVLARLRELKSGDVPWRNGRMFGYIYHPGDREAKVIEQAYHMFCNENALNPSLFSSLRKLENETVAMVADLLHAGEDYAGNMTTGGSESILVAVKTARDWARKNKPHVMEPEIIAPVTIHPAFSKACALTGVRVRYAPTGDDKRVDVAEVEKMINRNTILITASAPCFPYGVIDPVEEMGVTALDNNLLFHVDCCMGGLMLPFLEDLGYQIPLFDFRVKGVTSISADVHKYGYAPKGASVILYRNSELRKHQYFVMSSWPGGLYALKTIGRDGYARMADAVMKTTEAMKSGIEAIPGLKIIAEPVMSVFAFTSEKHDIYRIGDELAKRGWNLDKLQFPSALHMTVSYHNTGHEDEFLAALKNAVAAVEGHKIQEVSSHVLISIVRTMSKLLPVKWFRKLTSGFTGSVNNPEKGTATTGAAAYGMMVAIDNRENVDEIMLNVLDKLYSL